MWDLSTIFIRWVNINSWIEFLKIFIFIFSRTSVECRYVEPADQGQSEFGSTATDRWNNQKQSEFGSIATEHVHRNIWLNQTEQHVRDLVRDHVHEYYIAITRTIQTSFEEPETTQSYEEPESTQSFEEHQQHGDQARWLYRPAICRWVSTGQLADTSSVTVSCIEFFK